MWRTHLLIDAALGQVIWHGECAEATAFLAAAAEDTVLQPGPSGVWSDDLRVSLEAHAFDVLVVLGPAGEPTLRRLHSQGAVRDSSALVRVEDISRQGFRRRN